MWRKGGYDMIKSMTGYGRAEETVDGRDIVVEIKSVNHRYFDFLPVPPADIIFWMKN